MKKITLYDMKTDFSCIENRVFIFTEDIEKLSQDHFFYTFEHMVNNYRYFSMDQLIYNTLYNDSILNSRANILYKKFSVPCDTINSFLKFNRFVYRNIPLEIENINESFQYIYLSMSHWMHKNFYEFYEFLVHLKMRYSSFFFSEICSFIKCNYTISTNMFFENWNEFIKFSKTCNIDLSNITCFDGNNLSKDFYSKSFEINLNNFVIYHEDLYVRNFFCYDRNKMPYGELFCFNGKTVIHEEKKPNSIRLYIKPKLYSNLYDEYMSILKFSKPRSIYNILSREIYQEIMVFIKFGQINEKIISIVNNIKLYEENNIIMHEKYPIIFYYKAYQIINHKMYLSSQGIYKFFAYNLNNGQVELIKMKRILSGDFEVIELKY